MTQAPLIAHIVYRFDVGGLENGIVNLINRMPRERYRHAIVALTECAPEFSRRIEAGAVELISMHKPPGHGFKLYPQMFRRLRALRPALVHTRNLAALEMTVPAALAGVAARVHGEHGWDAADPAGQSAKNRWLRRAYAPFVSHYVALSAHIETYLTAGVGLRSARVTRICNGVDAERFRPRASRARPEGMPFSGDDLCIFGTVGRLDRVKDQDSLVRAFASVCANDPQRAQRARLVIAGDGPWRDRLAEAVRASGCADRIWLAGARSDVPEILGALDVFVLPSLGEGISNTILEAMATALPVLATEVGGNAELVEEGVTGRLVPAGEPVALARVMHDWLCAPQQRREYGTAARARIEAKFSLDAMVRHYADLYDEVLARR